MNDADFNDWVIYHGRLFPKFHEWFGSQHADLINLWRNGLRFADLTMCKQISQHMALGEIDVPTGYSKHLPLIIKEEKRRAFNTKQQGVTQRYDAYGERVYDCHTCRDEGVVLIYAPQFLSMLKEGMDVEEAVRVMTVCNVRCPCSAGDRWKKYTAYAENQMVQWVGGLVTPMVRCTMSLTSTEQAHEAAASLGLTLEEV